MRDKPLKVSQCFREERERNKDKLEKSLLLDNTDTVVWFLNHCPMKLAKPCKLKCTFAKLNEEALVCSIKPHGGSFQKI